MNISTPKKAVDAGRARIAREESDISWSDIDFVPRISAYNALEQISEQAYEECEIMWWLSFTKEDQQKLQEMLDEALERWMDKTNNYPTFYKIEKVENLSI